MSETTSAVNLRTYIGQQNKKLFATIEHLWKVSLSLHNDQNIDDYTDNGRRHVEQVEQNIWRLILESGSVSLKDFNVDDLFVLSAAACCHDFGKAVTKYQQKSFPHQFKHGSGSAGFVEMNYQSLGLSRNKNLAKCISEVCRIYELPNKDFTRELKRIDTTSATSDSPVNIQKLAVILRTADILHIDRSRISDQYNQFSELKGIERSKYLARSCITGWDIDGKRVVIEAKPQDEEQQKAINSCQKYLVDNEWSSVRYFLRLYSFAYDLNIKIEHDRKVFLSYSSKDKEIAKQITNHLRRKGIESWLDRWELRAGDSIVKQIDKAISSSDYFVVLLSPNSVNSKWVSEELDFAVSRELDMRDITIIPVLVEDCRIPTSLTGKNVLDLRSELGKGMKGLLARLVLAPKIDFTRLKPKEFEKLVVDLLEARGFYGIVREWHSEGMLFDIKASYSSKDPFGREEEQTWLIQVKYYHRKRADLASVRELVISLASLPEKYRGLIITDSQLTSAAKDWLHSVQNRGRIEVRVVDGVELRRLLLETPELIRQHFAEETIR